MLLSLLMFVISSNLDNLVLGLSYGMKGIRIGPVSNLLVGLVTLAGTVVSMGAGKVLLAVLPPGAENVVGSLAVLAIGFWFLFSYLKKRDRSGGDWPQESPERFDRDSSQVIEPREALALGLALAANNMGLGVGASAIGLGVVATSLGSCLCSLFFLHLGNRAGRSWISRALGHWAEPLSALIIILMGLLSIFC